MTNLQDAVARIIDPEAADFSDLYDYQWRWQLALERAAQVIEFLAREAAA